MHDLPRQKLPDLLDLQQIQAPNSSLPSGFGRYHSGRSDVSWRVKELFRQAIRQKHAGADHEQVNHVPKTGPIKQKSC